LPSKNLSQNENPTKLRLKQNPKRGAPWSRVQGSGSGSRFPAATCIYADPLPDPSAKLTPLGTDIPSLTPLPN
jgi:hypothetical protein